MSAKGKKTARRKARASVQRATLRNRSKMSAATRKHLQSRG